MGNTEELSTALIEWVNTFGVSKQVKEWNELYDGVVIWKILKDIDAEYFEGPLPEPTAGESNNWIPKWTNLKHIYSHVTTYIPDECDALHQLSKSEHLDLQSIARGESRSQPVELLKWVLFAASVSPTSSQRLLPVIDGLAKETKISLAAAIMRMQNAEEDLIGKNEENGNSSEVDESTDFETSSERVMSSPPRASAKKDDLQYEAEIIALSRDNRALQAHNTDLQTELDNLHAYVENLHERVTEEDLGIGDNKGKRTSDSDEMRRIRGEWDKDKDLISMLESQNEELQKRATTYERELAKLKEDGRSRQDLRDEVQQLVIEREELLPKARGYLNLQKKVQSQQEEVKALEREKESLLADNQALREMEPLKERVAVLEKADHEKYNTIANNEQKIFEMKQYEKRLEHDLYVLGQSHESLKSVYERAQLTIAEQTERLQELETREPGSMLMGGGDLETELTEQDRQDEVIFKKPMSASLASLPADTSLLQRTIETLRKRCNNLEDQYLDVYEENLGLQETLREKELDTSANPFLHVQQKLQSALVELEQLKSRYVSDTSELTELKIQANSLPTPPNEATLESLMEAVKDNKIRQAYVEQLETDVEERRSLLRHTLLSHRGLRRIGDHDRRIAEGKIITEQLQVVRDAKQEEAEKAVNFAAQRLVEKIETGYVRAADAEKKAKDSAEQLASLRAELDKIKKNPSATASSDISQDEVNALQRENKFIASAWYDLVNRLQSNTVSVQRRSDPKHSWIGRQRGIVGGAVGTRK